MAKDSFKNEKGLGHQSEYYPTPTHLPPHTISRNHDLYGSNVRQIKFSINLCFIFLELKIVVINLRPYAPNFRTFDGLLKAEINLRSF
jgi:hypothetical protein